jgi:drug/metabolite transporter (DMT)-like permease
LTQLHDNGWLYNIAINNKVIGYACGIVSAVLFGGMYNLSKSIDTVNPILLSCLIFLIAGATISPFSRIPARPNALLLAIAITGSVAGPVIFFFGIQRTSASHAAVLSNSEVVFSVLLAFVLFKEKVKRLGFFGVLLVLIGVFIVATTNGYDPTVRLGDALVIGSAFLYAIDNNLSTIATKYLSISKILQLKFLIGGLILGALVLILHTPLKITYAEIPNLLLIAVGCFPLAFMLFYRSLKEIGTSSAIMTVSTYNIFALLFAYLFLHENVAEIYSQIHEHIDENLTFKLEVSYDLTITK